MFKILFLLLFFYNSLFAIAIDVIAVTNDVVFDYFFSISLNLLWVLAPTVGALSLFTVKR